MTIIRTSMHESCQVSTNPTLDAWPQKMKSTTHFSYNLIEKTEKFERLCMNWTWVKRGRPERDGSSEQYIFIIIFLREIYIYIYILLKWEFNLDSYFTSYCLYLLLSCLTIRHYSYLICPLYGIWIISLLLFLSWSKV